MLPASMLSLLVVLLPLLEGAQGSTDDSRDLLGGAARSIQLQRRNHLHRRSSQDAVREWALREKQRIQAKYGVWSEIVRRTTTTTTDVPRLLDKRQQQFSTAGYSSTPTTNLIVGTRTFASPTTTMPTGTDSPKVNVTIGKVDVMNYEADLEYFAAVGVGAPPQYINTILDTGSADLWIASDGCSAFSGCINTPLFNKSLSTALNPANVSFLVNYGSGSAAGDLYNDYVGLGGYNVSQQGFALVDEVTTGLITGNLSGMMGLGWKPLAASGQTPFWQNLWQASVLPFPGFAFQLSRYVNDSSAASIEPGGSFTIGYLNDSLYVPPVNYVNMSDNLKSYWVIPMDAVNVNGTNITNVDSPLVAIDTGTTLIGGPASAIQNLYSLIPGAQAAQGAYAGYYHYPCNSSVNVSLAFGGVMYNMSTADFNLGPFSSVNNVSTCLGSIFQLSLSSSARISWVVGASFLKNVYSVFRASPPSVGFALLSNGTSIVNGTSPRNSSTSSITQVPTGVIGPTSEANTSTSTQAPPTTAIQAGQTVSSTPNPSSSGTVLMASIAAQVVAIASCLLFGFVVIL